jgi:hypothetical protein
MSAAKRKTSTPASAISATSAVRARKPYSRFVERGGRVRSHHIPNVTAKTLRPIMDDQIADATRTMSDDGGARIRHGSPDHHSVNPASASTSGATCIRTQSRVISRS